MEHGVNHNSLGVALLEIFKLPKHTTRITIDCRASDPVIVTHEFMIFPDETVREEEEFKTQIAKYKLVPIEG